MTPRLVVCLLAPASLVVACSGATVAPEPCLTVETADTATVLSDAPAEHRNLHSVLWTQTAVEYAAQTTQTWRAALALLDDAVADPAWTAVVEQLDDEGYDALPPAIVLDLDETVMDNSAYQAWLITSGESYSSSTWNAWCEDRAASPVPGAVDFLQAVADAGVEVFYISNRRVVVEDATVQNLRAWGLDTDNDHVFTRGEVDESSEKSARREAIIANYRVVMLFGDNFGDFLDGVEADLASRDAMSAEYDAWWGTRWFVQPNPQYGSWVGAITFGEEGDALTLLRDGLHAWRGPRD